MKRVLMVLLAAGWLASAASAQQREARIVRETIPLRFITAAEVARSFEASTNRGDNGPEGSASLLPEQFVQIVPSNRRNSLMLRGTAEGIGRAREIIALLDAPSQPIRLEMRLLRRSTTEETTNPETVSDSPAIVAYNNRPATVTLHDSSRRWSVMLLPKLNGDGSVTLSAEMNRARPGDRSARLLRSNLRVEKNKTGRVLSFTDTDRSAPRKSDVMYTLEVQPTPIPDIKNAQPQQP